MYHSYTPVGGLVTVTVAITAGGVDWWRGPYMRWTHQTPSAKRPETYLNLSTFLNLFLLFPKLHKVLSFSYNLYRQHE